MTEQNKPRTQGYNNTKNQNNTIDHDPRYTIWLDTPHKRTEIAGNIDAIAANIIMTGYPLHRGNKLVMTRSFGNKPLRERLA